jgi:hypothetical protein
VKRNNPLFPLQYARKKNIGLGICAWDEITPRNLARFCTSIKYPIVIYRVKAEFPITKSLNCGIIMLFAWFELFVLSQSLSAKIASMSISELLTNRPAAAMIFEFILSVTDFCALNFITNNNRV